jgi:threonine/homoserine/homoserine lactone efflux protein
MSIELYLAYVAACILLVIVPGPTVALIVAIACDTARGPGCLTSSEHS